MYEVTDNVFRRFLVKHGKPDVMFTGMFFSVLIYSTLEFVSVDGLVEKNPAALNRLRFALFHASV